MTFIDASPRPADPILAMSAKDATEALAALHTKYLESTKPAPSSVPVVNDARRLNELTKDRDFGARLVRGDTEATAEFARLNASVSDPANMVDLALAGQLPRNHVDGVPGSMSMRDMAAAANDLRSRGWSEPAIREALDGNAAGTKAPYSPETIAQAKERRAERLSDPEWKQRWLKGGYTEVRESQMLSSIIAQAAVEL